MAAETNVEGPSYRELTRCQREMVCVRTTSRGLAQHGTTSHDVRCHEGVNRGWGGVQFQHTCSRLTTYIVAGG